jgi:hypothetical protein
MRRETRKRYKRNVKQNEQGDGNDESQQEARVNSKEENRLKVEVKKEAAGED